MVPESVSFSSVARARGRARGDGTLAEVVAVNVVDDRLAVHGGIALPRSSSGLHRPWNQRQPVE
jgi:hypothetical protein